MTPECWVHKKHSNWWYRSDGSAVCGECHPRPDTVIAPEPLIRNVRTKK